MENQQIVLQVGVKILLKNKAGRYLLLKRNPEKYPDMRSSWDIPGGRIDAGCDLLTNLKRELKEETQLDLACEPKLVAAQDILRPGRHIVRLTFTGEMGGEPVIDEEHTEAGWMTKEEILGLGEQVDGYFRELVDGGVIVLG